MNIKNSSIDNIMNIMSSGCPVRPPRSRFRSKTERSKRVEEQRAPKESRKRKVPQRQADDQRGAWGLPKYPGYTSSGEGLGSSFWDPRISRFLWSLFPRWPRRPTKRPSPIPNKPYFSRAHPQDYGRRTTPSN